jgi:hypothetical protein
MLYRPWSVFSGIGFQDMSSNPHRDDPHYPICCSQPLWIFSNTLYLSNFVHAFCEWYTFGISFRSVISSNIVRSSFQSLAKGNRRFGRRCWFCFQFMTVRQRRMRVAVCFERLETLDQTHVRPQ